MKPQFRQGDVFLDMVVLPPILASTIRLKATPDAPLVLATGEVTGHTHVIIGDAELLKIDGQRYLTELSETGVSLAHVDGQLQPTTDHNPVHIPAAPPGMGYQVHIQREYTPRGYRHVTD